MAVGRRMSVEAIRIGLIGDRDDEVLAHRAVPEALRLGAEVVGVSVRPEWLATDAIRPDASFSSFAGLWAVPATPYRDTAGALHAIRSAREARIPFLGTCGGFQHAILEWARNVLGWSDAAHAETDPDARRAVVAPLACALVERTDEVRFVPGTRIARAYDRPSAVEGYHCRYGVSGAFRRELTAGPLRESALDASGDVRAVELDDHPFFVATLFQPERAALAHRTPPLVAAFVRVAAAARTST